MGLVIEMPTNEKFDIAAYLHRKYRERVRATPDSEPAFTMTMLAAEIGIEYHTLNSIYNQRGGVQRLSLEILQKLVAYYGRDFTDEFGLTPPSKPGEDTKGASPARPGKAR